MKLNELVDLRKELKDKVKKIFNGDDAKAEFWFQTENPNFGGSCPNDLILLGRGHKVKAFVDAALQDQK